MIIETNLIPDKFDAVSVWPFIFVRTGKLDSVALIAHEKYHYNRQRWITPIWYLRYWFSKQFRWEEEVAAYKIQLGTSTMTADYAAQLITFTYNTGKSYEETLAALLN